MAQCPATEETGHVPPAAIAAPAGAQEAMVVALRGLCAEPGDVLLTPDPCYVGIVGAAALLDIEVVPVPEPGGGIEPAEVARVARAVRAQGKRPRAFYLVPNFANPSGVSLSTEARHELLAVAADQDLLMLEDDPYGLFPLAAEGRPSLKALDTDQRVIYLGSFAKSVFPGARVGFLVADQTVVDADGRRTLLAEELSAVKSMLTVNTAPITQAVIGGLLGSSGRSLRAAKQEEVGVYPGNLRGVLSNPGPGIGRVAEVTWNSPD